MDFLIYIFKVISIQAIFSLLYISLLKKETFFTGNRWYLIITAVLALILPLVKIPVKHEYLPIQLLPEVLMNKPDLVTSNSLSHFNTINWFLIIYLIITMVFMIVFLYKLSIIIRLIVKHKHERNSSFYLVKSDQIQGVYSFFNRVFINKNLEIDKMEMILKHEEIHISELHSLDLLFFEILKVILWVNPFNYLYNKEIKLIHEYIADKKVLQKTDKENYINNLLNHTFDTQEFAFTHNFYKQSLIKNRIIMMTKNQSRKWKRMNYLWVFPITLIFMLFNFNMIAQEDFQKNAKEVVEFINEHPNSRDLSQKDYKKYVNLSKKVNPDKKFNTYQEYKSHVSNDKTFVLYSVSQGDGKGSKLIKNYMKSVNDFVPFAIIDEAPVYPGCEGNSREETMQCFSKKIMEHVAANFNTKIADDIGLPSGKQRLFAMFTISQEGKVEGIKARAPHKALEDEAIRVINLLPKMQPGKQDGKHVNVKYSLPISFIVEEKPKKK